jgi:hypothetical protein
MVGREQRVPGQPAPRRKIRRRAGVPRDELQHGAWRQTIHAKPQLQHQVAAAEVAGVPRRIGHTWLAHDALTMGVARV